VHKRLTLMEAIKVVSPMLASASESIDLTQYNEEIVVNGAWKNLCCCGEISSVYALKLGGCLAKLHPPSKLAIDKIAASCPIVCSTDLTDKFKQSKVYRFLAYWWYGTHIYLFCGRGHRSVMY